MARSPLWQKVEVSHDLGAFVFWFGAADKAMTLLAGIADRDKDSIANEEVFAAWLAMFEEGVRAVVLDGEEIERELWCDVPTSVKIEAAQTFLTGKDAELPNAAPS